jgi:hypothetical protein
MVDTVKAQSLLSLDTTPIAPVTAGQGGGTRIVTVDDYCAATATGLAASTSWYKLCRFPTGAVLKSVTLATDKAPDTSTSVLFALDLNIIFSDAASPAGDGTPTWYQGLIPTTANTGGTTTIASYSSPNKLFGTVNPSSHTAGYGPTDVVFNGIGSTYNFLQLVEQPLWQTFGFVDGRSSPADPGGYFDLLAFVATASGTGQACNIWARVSYATT